MEINTFLTKLNSISFNYVGPAICLVGFILGIFCFVTFYKLAKEKIYFYLMTKTFLEIFLFAIGTSTPYLSCIDCLSAYQYHSQWLKLIFYLFLRRFLRILITLSEIALTFIRYSLIGSSSKLITKKKDKIYLLLIGLIVILISIPKFFAFKIRSLGVKNDVEIFVLTNTEFGWTLAYSIYSEVVDFTSSIITLLILIPINIIMVIRYRKFIKNKNRLVTQNNRLNKKKQKSEDQFTKMILITSLLFIICNFLNESVNIYLIFSFYSTNSSQFYQYYYFIFGTFVTLGSYFIYSLNFFIYYHFNTPFRNRFKKTFLCKKIPN